LNYAVCPAVHWDPVEKKPLYHFFPGRSILSLGTYGCNLHCRFCQNWSLARGRVTAGEKPVTPQAVIAILNREGGPDRALGVAFTYNEPSVWYEYVFDTARLLKEHGYRAVLVTNGYIGIEALENLLPFIDAMNIDVKSFSDKFYRTFCGGTLEPVIKTVEAAVSRTHVEITNLLIPTLNDSPAELEQLVDWLTGLSPAIPLHLSRYYPQYRLDLPPTPLETMHRARAIARRKLHYVYLGNVGSSEAAHTYCPHCHLLLIRRNVISVEIEGLNGNRCRQCNNAINLVL
jgi:pyruvate formate lyase activating enzyme